MVPKDHKWNENDKKNLSNKFYVDEFLGGRIYKRSRENNRIKKTGYKSIIGQLNKLYKIYFIYGCFHLFTQLKVVQNVRPFAPHGADYSSKQVMNNWLDSARYSSLTDIITNNWLVYRLILLGTINAQWAPRARKIWLSYNKFNNSKTLNLALN